MSQNHNMTATTIDVVKQRTFSSRPCSQIKFNRNPIKIWVEKLFYKQGLIVGQHPLFYILIPLIISLVFCGGLFKITFNPNNGIMAIPLNAYSNYESKVFLDYFHDEGGLFYFIIGFMAKDGGSLLREEYQQDVLAFYEYFMHNYTVAIGGKLYNFASLQVNHNDDNAIPLSILKMYNESEPPFKFTYPVFVFNEEPYYIGDVVRKVETDPKTNIVNKVKLIWLRFNSSQKNKTHEDLLKAWGKSFIEHPKIDTVFPRLDYFFWNDEVAGWEIMRNCSKVAPFVVLAFIVVIIFAFIVTSTKNPITSKPLEALSSIVACLLASGSGFGIVFYMGYPFTGMIIIIPILVLGLGMDVTYITLRNWRCTSVDSPPHIRLAETLRESGPSVVITALTNVLSAAIGCYTNTLFIFVFCMTLSISLTILFVLQITFFAGFIAYSGRREAAKKHGWLICLTVKTDGKNAVSNNYPDLVTSQYEYFDWWSTCAKKLAHILTTRYCCVCVITFTLVYWASAVYCCMQMKLGLTIEKLFLPDSLLLQTIHLDADVSKAGRLLYIIVSNPPNFLDKKEMDSFNQMINDFESSPYCIGSNATSFWLRPFNGTFLGFFDDDLQNNFYRNLDDFLSGSTGSRWKNYIKTEKINGTISIKRFLVTVAYQRTFDWNIRNNYTFSARAIASRYPQFNVTSWVEDNANFITDQLTSLPGNTIQDLIVTTVCMTVVCIMFIPNVFNTLCAILTVFSINIGTFGYLLVWDVALDPISMTCLLLSIGYSVDFISHISYHYYVSQGTSQEEKLASALSSIGLPMMESGLSTLLCVACLCFVPSYFELVFFKNIFLVILFGLLHGLIILPTFLACIPLNCLDKLFMKKGKTYPIDIVSSDNKI